MKIATLTVLFCRHPLEKVFQIASSQGYDGIELWGGRPHAYPYDMDEERIADVLRMKEQYHLEIPMYTPELLAYPYNVATQDPVERQDTIDYLKRAVEVAKAIESPRMQLTCGHAGYGTSRKKNFENILSVLRQIVDHAEKVGVDIIVEPVTLMESNTIFLLDDLVELIEYLDSDRLKTMMDTVTPLVHWEPYSDHFERLGKKLDYVHFVDSNGVTQSHMPLGTGIIDLPGLLKIMRRHGYDGWLCIELIAAGIHEPEMYAGRDIRILKQMLTEI
jgi:protein FrlC